MFGYSFERPARHMKEYLNVLLPATRGEQVDYTGETVRGHVRLATPGAGVPVLIAALGPRMLKLAGTVADGTVLWMTGPKTVAEHIAPAITAAAARGRAARAAHRLLAAHLRHRRRRRRQGPRQRGLLRLRQAALLPGHARPGGRGRARRRGDRRRRGQRAGPDRRSWPRPA